MAHRVGLQFHASKLRVWHLLVAQQDAAESAYSFALGYAASIILLPRPAVKNSFHRDSRTAPFAIRPRTPLAPFQGTTPHGSAITPSQGFRCASPLANFFRASGSTVSGRFLARHMKPRPHAAKPTTKRKNLLLYLASRRFVILHRLTSSVSRTWLKETRRFLFQPICGRKPNSQKVITCSIVTVGPAEMELT